MSKIATTFEPEFITRLKEIFEERIVFNSELGLKIDAGTLTFERRPQDLATVVREGVADERSCSRLVVAVERRVDADRQLSEHGPGQHQCLLEFPRMKAKWAAPVLESNPSLAIDQHRGRAMGCEDGFNQG